MKEEDFYKFFMEKLPKVFPYLKAIRLDNDEIKLMKGDMVVLTASIDNIGFVLISHEDVKDIGNGFKSIDFEMLVRGDEVHIDYDNHAIVVNKDHKNLVDMVI